MSVIIRLQGLSWSASAMDIRKFFQGLSIPPGGVHIVGGDNGDAFIAFSTDEDARQAMMLSNKLLNETPVQLFLSSKTEMQTTITKAKEVNNAVAPAPVPAPPMQQVPMGMNMAPNFGSQPSAGFSAQIQSRLQTPQNNIPMQGLMNRSGETVRSMEHPLPGEYSIGGIQNNPPFGENSAMNQINRFDTTKPFPTQQNTLGQDVHVTQPGMPVSENKPWPNDPKSILQNVSNLLQGDLGKHLGILQSAFQAQTRQLNEPQFPNQQDRNHPPQMDQNRFPEVKRSEADGRIVFDYQNQHRFPGANESLNRPPDFPGNQRYRPPRPDSHDPRQYTAKQEPGFQKNFSPSQELNTQSPSHGNLGPGGIVPGTQLPRPPFVTSNQSNINNNQSHLPFGSSNQKGISNKSVDNPPQEKSGTKSKTGQQPDQNKETGSNKEQTVVSKDEKDNKAPDAPKANDSRRSREGDRDKSRSSRGRSRDRSRDRDRTSRDRSKHQDSPRYDRDRRDRDRGRDRDGDRYRRDRDRDRDRRNRDRDDSKKDRHKDDSKRNSPSTGGSRSSRKRSLSPDSRPKDNKKMQVGKSDEQTADTNSRSSANDKSEKPKQGMAGFNTVVTSNSEVKHEVPAVSTVKPGLLDIPISQKPVPDQGFSKDDKKGNLLGITPPGFAKMDNKNDKSVSNQNLGYRDSDRPLKSIFESEVNNIESNPVMQVSDRAGYENSGPFLGPVPNRGVTGEFNRFRNVESNDSSRDNFGRNTNEDNSFNTRPSIVMHDKPDFNRQGMNDHNNQIRPNFRGPQFEPRNRPPFARPPYNDFRGPPGNFQPEFRGPRPRFIPGQPPRFNNNQRFLGSDKPYARSGTENEFDGEMDGPQFDHEDHRSGYFNRQEDRMPPYGRSDEKEGNFQYNSRDDHGLRRPFQKRDDTWERDAPVDRPDDRRFRGPPPFDRRGEIDPRRSPFEKKGNHGSEGPNFDRGHFGSHDQHNDRGPRRSFDRMDDRGFDRRDDIEARRPFDRGDGMSLDGPPFNRRHDNSAHGRSDRVFDRRNLPVSDREEIKESPFRESNQVKKAGNDSESKPNKINSGESNEYFPVILERIPVETTYKDVRRLFSDCEIPRDGIKILNNEKGKRIGKIYVKFLSQVNLKKGMKKDRTKLRDCYIFVRPVPKKEFDEAVDSYLPSDNEEEVAGDRSRNIDLCNTLSATLRTLKGEPELVLPSKKQMMESDDPIIKVTQLPPNTSEENIKAFFRTCTIADKGNNIVFEINDKGVFTGTCYVEFKDSVSYGKALKYRCIYEDKPILIQPAKKADRDSLSQLNKSKAGQSENVVKSVPENNSKVHDKQLVSKDTTCVHLKHIPMDFGNVNIKHLFAGQNIIPRGIQVCHDAIGKPLGEAFVEFSSNSDVNGALRKDGTPIGRGRLSVAPIAKDKMINYLRDLRQSLLPEAPTQQATFFFVKATNLPKNVSTGELMRFFSGYMPAPESIRLNIGDPSDTESAGTALIGFRDRENAERTVAEKNKAKIKDRVVGLTKVII